MEKNASGGPLVVVGSSAGGIEALATLVSTLPSDFPAPIVIAQHLDPRRISHLEEILSRHSTLPVRTVTNHEPLQPGTVFVVPSNRHVQVSDHAVELRDDHDSGRSKPSVDLLLSTAAKVYGERLVAVILTGAGSDGSIGARDVKQAGGTVIVQNPETASHPGMPLSVAATTVDIVANLRDIGGVLYDLLARTAAPVPSGEEHALQTLLEHVRERNGIDFSAYKVPTIQRRLQRRLVATGSGSIAEYMRFLRRNPEEYERLVSSFLIMVTEFFRDPELFDYLRDHVVPAVVADARARDNELRLWSAGCATGEEAYSLAMLVADHLGDELERFTVRIFSTDLNADVLAFARRGIYPPSALAALPEALIARHFAEVEGGYEVRKQVRSMVVFGQHDLAQRAAFPRIDAVLCRNVLIYFTVALQKRALQVFAFSLRDGGYLVLGKAETSGPQAEFFAMEEPALKVYRRRGDRLAVPARSPGQALPPGPLRVLPGRSIPVRREGARDARHEPPPPQYSDSVLRAIPAGIALVDRRYTVLTINPAATRLLGIRTTAIGEGFLQLVNQVALAPLRSAIDAAFRGDATSTVEELEVTEAATAETRVISLTCTPHRTDPTATAPDAVILYVADDTAKVRQRRENEQQLRAIERQAEQSRTMADTGRELLAANQELAQENLQLRAMNETFVIGTEEAQAAAEEAETLNEELQASNEELETLNEELQATNEELEATNQELHSRTAELQHLAISVELQRRTAEQERTRLASILGGIGDAVLVVDRQGHTIHANPAYDEMARHLGAGYVFADEHGIELVSQEKLQQRAARGEPFSLVFVVSAADGSRRWLEANGYPIRGEPEPQNAVVIRDITDRNLRRLEEEFVALATHELRTPLTAVRGYLDRLVRAVGPEADERVRRWVQAADDQARRLTTLVTDLTDIARLQGGSLALSLEQLDLRDVVSRSVETARDLDDAREIRLDLPSDPIPVRADPLRFEQVLLNLLTNAMTYTQSGTRIDIRARQSGDEAELAVRDYGPGIPAADVPHLFSRYYRSAQAGRARGRGLGLGLFISHEIVEAHGGDIAVHSVAGDGSTFSVRLPIAKA